MYFLILKNVMVNLFSYIATSLYDASHPLSSYIPIASFSKLVWLLTIFFTYSFYPLTHCTQICRPTTWLIHAILFGQQFDIGKSFFISWLPIVIHFFNLVVFLLRYLSLVSSRTSDSIWSMPRGFKLLIPHWIRTYGPSVIVTYMVPWHPKPPKALRIQHRHNK